MIVYVDADGCPVVDIALQLCKKHSITCVLVCDTAHSFSSKNADIITVDKGSDSVDFAIANRLSPGDIVITQDYGLASMCLSRNAIVLHQDGWAYTTDNIDTLLLQRYEARKLRSSGGRMKGPKKRSNSQNQAFSNALEKLLNG